MVTRYQPTAEGYQIMGSREVFNRALYGGHGHDQRSERYFVLAGDQPLVMGCLTDWRARQDCTHAKAGVLMIGVGHTPGLRVPQFCYTGRDEDDGDRASQWFHHCGDTIATYANGWMTYELQPLFQCGPQVKAQLEVLPLQEADGFLVSLDVWTDQRTWLCIAFGGVTDYLGRLEFPIVRARDFHAADCRGTTVSPGENRACVRGRHHAALAAELWVGTSFPAQAGAAPAALADGYGPGRFMAPDTTDDGAPMARLMVAIEPQQRLRGHVVVLRNEPETVLNDWLARDDAAAHTRRMIRAKHAAIEVRTPDAMLDLTVPSVTLAMDATWHAPSFHHGAYAWHAPYLGWRNWYGPTVLGWHDRVEQAFRTHAANRVAVADGPETVAYDGPAQYGRLNHSYGFIPELPDRRGIFYNMQEVGVDMFLHHLEWTGRMASAETQFETLADVLAWEARILDPDQDGLYQNWLNTWISDAHSYNGGGCAQASAYNYRANRTLAMLAARLGRPDAQVFAQRAEHIRQAVHDRLWIPEKGLLAEYVDTVGQRRVHDSPELATVYHAIEAGLVDPFQAYTMLRFTETSLRNERTRARGGRLVWSSNWWPQNYSSCGLYTCENLHLAWAYFQLGLAARGMDILNAVVDAHFMGANPGMAAHCMVGSGYTSGSQDFSEISSMHLRTVVEGLFGVRLNLLEDEIRVTPNIPPTWESARLKIPDMTLELRREGLTDIISLATPHSAMIRLAWPLRSATVESVTINRQAAAWECDPAIGGPRMVVRLPAQSPAEVVIRHGSRPLPELLRAPDRITAGDRLVVEVAGGELVAVRDAAGVCQDMTLTTGQLTAAAVNGPPGHYTVFARLAVGPVETWLPVDFEIVRKPESVRQPRPGGRFRPIPLTDRFNCELTAIHQQEYWRPRPAGYSIGMRLNGRFGWDWNHGGHLGTLVDDRSLRNAGGIVTTPAGIPFATPPEGPNVACASIWENFPDEIEVPLAGTAHELAILFVAATNPMQAEIENARLIVAYDDGEPLEHSLIHPRNMDDWLNPALQTVNETVCFSAVNHAIVQRLPLDATRSLRSLTVRVLANEVIIGLLGVSVRGPAGDG